MLSPYSRVSDFGGPYSEAPYYREEAYRGGPYYAPPPQEAPAPPPRYGYGYGYGPAPALMPAHEVYNIIREAGFSPLGIPRQRGYVYTIAVIDRGGEDGRLVIDARSGQIIRFTPAWRTSGNFGGAYNAVRGQPGPMPPQAMHVAGAPRPPGLGAARREPHRARAEAEPAGCKRGPRAGEARCPDRRQAGRRTVIAAGSRRAGQTGRRRAGHRHGRAGAGQAGADHPAHAGNAEGAGAGLIPAAAASGSFLSLPLVGRVARSAGWG